MSKWNWLYVLLALVAVCVAVAVGRHYVSPLRDLTSFLGVEDGLNGIENAITGAISGNPSVAFGAISGSITVGSAVIKRLTDGKKQLNSLLETQKQQAEINVFNLTQTFKTQVSELEQVKSNLSMQLDNVSLQKEQLEKTSTLEINGLQNITSILNQKIDSLATTLTTTDNKLDEITATKNSMGIFGMEVNKITYNTITWALIAGLLFFLAMGFLAFKRNLFVVYHTKKELEELKSEFETYRQTTREAREKMSMDHFNELKRLKEQ